MSTPTSWEQVNEVLVGLRGQIQTLENENKRQQEIINAGAAQLEALGKSKIKLEAPAKYEGKKEDLSRFLTEMASYIEHYKDRFGTEATKTRYAASRLTGQPARWFEPTLKDHVENPHVDQHEFTQKVFDDYASFGEELTKVFGDGDEQVHAQDRLARLRQSKSAAAYATLFRQDAIRAGINEAGLMQLFYDGLKEDVKDEIYKDDRPATLDEYIAKAVRIDDRLYARKQQKKGQQKLIVGGNQANEGKKRHEGTSYGTRPGPMEIDAVQTKWPNKQPRDKSNITCYNCGKKGHYKRECRSLQKQNKTPGRWSPVPGREAAVIEKGVKFKEVAASSSVYHDDVDHADYQEEPEDEFRFWREDEEFSDVSEKYKEEPTKPIDDYDERLRTDEMAEVGPYFAGTDAPDEGGWSLTQNSQGEWNPTKEGEEPGLNPRYLSKKVLESRDKIDELRQSIRRLKNEVINLQRRVQEGARERRQLLECNRFQEEELDWRRYENKGLQRLTKRLLRQGQPAPWAVEWLREHRTIDAASQGADRSALQHQRDLGNDSGPSEGPVNH